MITFSELAAHSSQKSCWVALYGQVYDVTDFLNSHPGGVKSILRWAGKDATEEYDPIHPAGAIKRYLPQKCHLGPLDLSTLPAVAPVSDKAPQQSESEVMPLSTVMNLDDFEISAEKVIHKRAWTYIHSAADGLGSFKTNQSDWAKVSFRPRILRDVTRIDMFAHSHEPSEQSPALHCSCCYGKASTSRWRTMPRTWSCSSQYPVLCQYVLFCLT